MSNEKRISLERADKLAAAIIKELQPYCVEGKVMVAGSVRRRRLWVHDIDIVLIPANLWGLHSRLPLLFKSSNVKMAGGKTARIKVAEADVDFYFATPENWANILLIRTGSTTHNIRLCKRAQERGWQLKANGDGLFNEKGERIAGDTELSIFQALGLPYKRPEERD
jgi:DNA polymerase (family 10)